MVKASVHMKSHGGMRSRKRIAAAGKVISGSQASHCLVPTATRAADCEIAFTESEPSNTPISIYPASARAAMNAGNSFAPELLAASIVSVCEALLYTGTLNRDLAGLIENLRGGDARALARAISMVENRAPGWSELLKALFPYTGHARVIGLTGAPGAGKSTLVDELARWYRSSHSPHAVPQNAKGGAIGGTENPHSSRKERGLNGAPDHEAPDHEATGGTSTVGIIAVDPTSPYTGGAILGDRIRMQEHFSDPGIYIRSMATRGSLGGLARTTADVATLLDAAGRDVILIETVGVGQDEIDIVRLAEITVVILVPGMGDDVQSIKAGIMEIADIFVINKSDRDGAENVEKEIRALQSLAMRRDGWTPPIVKTVASEGAGIAELAAAIADYETYLQGEDRALKKSVENWQERLIEMLRDAMLDKARAGFGDGNLARLAAEVAEHKRDPYTLVEEIAEKSRK
jgi:LAO/AO transport system kinase